MPIQRKLKKEMYNKGKRKTRKVHQTRKESVNQPSGNLTIIQTRIMYCTNN